MNIQVRPSTPPGPSGDPLLAHHLLAYDDDVATLWSRSLEGLVVVTANVCPDYLLHLLDTGGARGLVCYDGCAEHLRAAVQSICAGQGTYFGPGLHSLLTVAERDVLHGVGLGQGNRQLALLLGRSEQAVRRQLDSVMVKLGLHRRAELRLYYLGWLDAPIRSQVV